MPQASKNRNYSNNLAPYLEHTEIYVYIYVYNRINLCKNVSDWQNISGIFFPPWS